MLSLIDLVERETITIERASWLTARIQEGASWLVGARPGGAGKTAIMCALLAMLPEDEPVHLANPGTGWESAGPGQCILAYEIGSGSYDAYVWGEELRRMAALGVSGARLVSNLHADTREQARAQLVDENGVSEQGFGAFGTFIPIEARGVLSRSGPAVGPMSVWQGETWVAETDISPSRRQGEIAGFLRNCVQKGIKTVEDVRAAWLLEGRRRP